MTKKLTARLTTAVAIATFATALSTANGATAGEFAKSRYTTPLADVCPSPFIIQKDWLAQAEQGPLYQLIGSGGDMTSGQYKIGRAHV